MCIDIEVGGEPRNVSVQIDLCFRLKVGLQQLEAPPNFFFRYFCKIAHFFECSGDIVLATGDIYARCLTRFSRFALEQLVVLYLFEQLLGRVNH